jgi:ssDNA-binding replication factor A large subunit
MIKIPYEEILQKITAGSGIGSAEIEERVKKKMDQLSGLISKEGAAHIIANELNVQIYSPVSGRLQVKSILPGLRNVEVVARIAAVYELREFKVGEREGKVASIMVGDETGRIRVALWGSVAEKIKAMKVGDIVKITGAYARENNGFKELHANERSEISINPAGEFVEELSVKQSRKNISELAEGDNTEILGAIVDMFDPRFFEVCPECGKRMKNEVCEQHPGAGIAYSFVINAFIDDGTDNVRAVFFRDQVGKLLSMSDEEILKVREFPESFSEVKKRFLGTIIKASGRAVKNQMFERIEFIVNSVVPNPDPEEEIKRLA